MLCFNPHTVNTCPALEPLENGMIEVTEVGFEGGFLATYECNEGYTISSFIDSTRVCTLSGEWTGEPPTCIGTSIGMDMYWERSNKKLIGKHIGHLNCREQLQL